ncbi:hypothetical protein CEP88_19000 [Roseobacter denitrificans]|uniref:Uncharacterized protein n=1 Tax=Roseobacter denitrificans (strain ATCC 33942 / OCh 114) TaxID=375451 RepID=Q168Y1_ROSDO|nr:hypothetical protein [Roseobacter denitrificans]ABG31462.1 hypothetical protein RD1_1850 [Roseobacter denitrificans OCh 114]AVL54468.1 hypothetical protein CEP88_19000 [Roseobacter denitrificans]SFG51174.1 hypothetical protein SAMN05443635_1293 [Roseobacter denitrificans OCh 114]
MDKNSGDIDWDQLPKDQRIDLTKNLFKAVSGVADLNSITIAELIDQAFLGLPKVGTDYDSNFRRGNVSAAKAMLMHRWLEENHFELAKTFAPELFQMNPKRAWNRFLDSRSVDGGLRIVQMKNEFGIAQRADKMRKVSKALRFGDAFCLELTSDRFGHAIAFQGYRGKYYPLALSGDERRLRIAITDGVQLLLRDLKGQPNPLVEMDDAGDHRFVVITSPDKNLPTDQRRLASRFDDEGLQVFHTDVRFVT